MHEGDNGQKHPLLTAYNSTVYLKAFEEVNCQNVLWQENQNGECYRQALDLADKQVGRRTRMRSVSSFLEIPLNAGFAAKNIYGVRIISVMNDLAPEGHDRQSI